MLCCAIAECITNPACYGEALTAMPAGPGQLLRLRMSPAPAAPAVASREPVMIFQELWMGNMMDGWHLLHWAQAATAWWHMHLAAWLAAAHEPIQIIAAD